MSKNLVFVHVGKAGGGTIQQSIEKSYLARQYNCRRVHYNKPQYNNTDKYLFVLRNPVDRVISAYYWRKYLADNRIKNIPERAIFNDYSTIDSLIKNCPEARKKLTQVIHVSQGFASHYEGIDIISSDQILAVLCTHTLNSDLKEYLNIDSELEVRDNKRNQPETSDETRAFLTEYCARDYAAIEKLLAKHPISDEKREVVLKKWK